MASWGCQSRSEVWAASRRQTFCSVNPVSGLCHGYSSLVVFSLDFFLFLCILTNYAFWILSFVNVIKNLGNKSHMLHDLERHLSSVPQITLLNSWICSLLPRFKAQNNSAQVVKRGSTLVETIQSNMVSFPCPKLEFSSVVSYPGFPLPAPWLPSLLCNNLRGRKLTRLSTLLHTTAARKWQSQWLPGQALSHPTTLPLCEHVNRHTCGFYCFPQEKTIIKKQKRIFWYR